MTKYKIVEDEQGLKIKLTEMAGEEQQLLDEFEKCQQGKCSCPTDEYKKLDSMALELKEGQIEIQLSAKTDQKLDKEEITKCLEHTTKIAKKAE